MIYRGRMVDGKVVFDEAVELPNGTPVDVQVANTLKLDSSDDGPTLYERLRPFIGSIDGLPPDAAKNIDHYLYGHPKVE